jgi:hypothetical protein
MAVMGKTQAVNIVRSFAGIVILLLPGISAGDPVFIDPVYRACIDMPYLCETGDINVDGIPDFIVGPYNDPCVVAFLGAGDGSFLPVQTEIRFSIGSMSLCEVNGDDYPDLLVGQGDCEYEQDSLLVLLGDGAGSFIEHSVLLQDNNFITAGDLDGDGDSDLLVTLEVDSDIIIRICNGDATFGTGTAYHSDCGIGHTVSVVGDLNGDSFQDIAFPLACYSGYVLGTMLGNGDGTVQVASYHHYYPGGGGQYFCYATPGDFNGDSILDISSSSGMVIANVRHFIFLNDGTGEFTAVDSLGMCNAWQAIADFNMDGNLDIGVSGGGNRIFPGTGDGHFLTGPGDLLFYSVCEGQMGSADFDGDGDSDIVRADVDADTISVFLNITIPQGIEGGAVASDLGINVSPNPFSSSLSIGFSLPATGEAELSVYDLTGRLVAYLESSSLPSGEHLSTWSPGPDTPDGCYLIVLDACGERSAGRCVLLR